MSQTCVFMHSSLATDQIQIVNSRRLEDTLIAKKIAFEKIDGSMQESKELRDILFGVSKQRGKYPQCFLRAEDGTYTFVGVWDEIESLIECDDIPADVLAQNPQIKTFSSVSIIKIFDYFYIITRRTSHGAQLLNCSRCLLISHPVMQVFADAKKSA